MTRYQCFIEKEYFLQKNRLDCYLFKLIFVGFYQAVMTRTPATLETSRDAPFRPGEDALNQKSCAWREIWLAALNACAERKPYWLWPRRHAYVPLNVRILTICINSEFRRLVDKNEQFMTTRFPFVKCGTILFQWKKKVSMTQSHDPRKLQR